MRTVLIIILFFAGKALDGQTSFSAFKIDNYSSNIFQEFITVNDSSIIVKSQHFCNHHNGNILYECNVLTELDSKLQINHTHFVNEFISNCQNCIIKEKENFILLGKSLDEQLNQTSVDLKIFSNVFELISTDSIGLHVNPEHLNLRGLIRDTLRNSYIYGDKRDGNNSRSIQITKLDYLNNNIASYSIKRGVINEPFDLQFDRNGNLIISNKYFSQIGGSGEFGVQYVLLDSNLTLIDSFEYLNITEHPTVFLAHSNNFMFNTTKNHPDSFSLPSQGRINKYTETFDSLLWSIELPFDNFTNARKYKILDFEEGANGDILACGSVWDEEDDGPLQNSNNHVYNGFAVRVDQNGDIKWLRLYKIENDNPMLPKEEYGKFLQGGLTQIEELDNGQILMGGSIYHTPRQLSTIVSSSETRNYIWTMITNEEGCLDEFECIEIFNLKLDLKTNSVLEENSRWQYCLQIDGNETLTRDLELSIELIPKDSLHDYFEISGDYFSYHNLPYIDTMIIAKNNRNIFYLDKNDSLQMLNNFDVTVGDTLIQRFPLEVDSTWHINNPSVSDQYKLIIDSIQYIEISEKLLKRVYFTYYNEFDDDNQYIWTPVDLGHFYTENIGFENFFFPYVVTGYDDINTNCDLKKFESDNLFLENEIAYCRSVSNKETEFNNYISVFPNPSNSSLNIISDIEDFEYILIYSNNGTLKGKFYFQNILDISDLENGLYFIKIISNNKSYISKFIKV